MMVPFTAVDGGHRSNNGRIHGDFHGHSSRNADSDMGGGMGDDVRHGSERRVCVCDVASA